MGSAYRTHGESLINEHNFSRRTWREETTWRPRVSWDDNIKMYLKNNGFWGCGLDSVGSRQGPMRRYCEHGNEPTSRIKVDKFLFISNVPQTTACRTRKPLHGTKRLHNGGSLQDTDTILLQTQSALITSAFGEHPKAPVWLRHIVMSQHPAW
jgi:hypothetical protein